MVEQLILCGTSVVTLDTPWADNAECERIYIDGCGYGVKTRVDLIEARDCYHIV